MLERPDNKAKFEEMQKKLEAIFENVDHIANAVINDANSHHIDENVLTGEQNHVEMYDDDRIAEILLKSKSNDPLHASAAHLLALAQEWQKRRQKPKE
jgi:hypothetical protein